MRKPGISRVALVAGGIGAALFAGAVHGGPPEFEDCRLHAPGGGAAQAARCTRIAVPEDHGHPEGRHIELHVAVVPSRASQPAADPVVLLSGGPGQAASESYVEMHRLFHGIRGEREVLLIDQRGTGRSSPLQCPGVEESLEAPALTEDAASIAGRVRRCRDEIDADLRHYGSDAAVADLEWVREALDFEQLNLYGFSYGSRPAQLYAARHPQRTRSVVMDGVLPLTVPLGETIDATASGVVEDELAGCTEDAECAAALPGLHSAYTQLLGELAERPRQVAFEHPRDGSPEQATVNADELQRMLRLLAYQPETRVMIPLLLHRASEGALHRLVALARDFDYGLDQRIHWMQHLAVICREDQPHISPRVREASRELQLLGAACREWPGGARERFAETLPDTVPMLLLSGEKDPVTPHAPVAEMAEGYPLVRAVEAPGQGHIVSMRGCLPEKIAGFFRQPEPRAHDLECVARLSAPGRMLNLNGPTP